MIKKELQEDFMQMIQTHEGIIHKVVGLYVDDSSLKKDLYQEILYQAWKSYANFRKESKFSTWLYKIALNTALTGLKKNKKRKAYSESLDHELDVQNQPKNENEELLFYLVKKLNEIDRMLITLHLEGYSNKEIAEISGMTQNNANVKLHRVKNALIRKYKKIEND